jgi:hypothetical protein
MSEFGVLRLNHRFRESIQGPAGPEPNDSLHHSRIPGTGLPIDWSSAASVQMMARPKPDGNLPMLWPNCRFWLKFVMEERIIVEGTVQLGHEHE